MDKINVFLPAAGLGERLRPITSVIPKPLLPIMGKPVIEYALDQITNLSFDRIGINIYYQKEAFEKWIQTTPMRERLVRFDEDEICGTGGALKNAETLLNHGTFLVHNSDIVSDIDLKSLVDFHLGSGNLATLAIHDYQKFNCLIIDDHSYLRDIRKGPGRHVERARDRAYTGIAVYRPEFLAYLPQGRSSVVDAWMKAIGDGQCIGTYDVTGAYWNDIGMPSSYASAYFEAMKKEGENVYIHSSVKGCSGIGMKGYVAIEKECILNKSVELTNCIVLPDVSLREHQEEPDRVDFAGDLCAASEHSNCIIGPGFRVRFDDTPPPLVQGDKGRQLIGVGGSDRTYYRMTEKKPSVVIMQCREDDPDFERHIAYSEMFASCAVPVPHIMEIDREKKMAVLEDVGDVTLYNYLKCPHEADGILAIYRDVIDTLVLIHTDVTDRVRKSQMPEERMFDYLHCRWESQYFVEHFLCGLRDLSCAVSTGLDDELHRLAVNVDEFPKTVIHRDFQSQNIMITKGISVKIIDFQGARIGPPGYDVASLLWDPYYRLPDVMRKALIDYYINQVKASSDIPASDQKKMNGSYGDGGFNEVTFRDSILPCRLQRHMQALGAYACLSRIKGKKYFLKYVHEGTRLLKLDIACVKNEYPALFSLIERI